MASSSKHKNLSPEDLKAMKKVDLESLLKKRGLPLAGNKDELIERLRKYPNGCPKATAWQYSDAKKDLKRSLLDPSSPIHNMSVKDIWNSDSRYKRYPLFPRYYKDLKARVEAEKKQVQDDNVKAERHIKNNQHSLLNKRGYPHWNKHPAKALLEVDVANKVHERMSRTKLQQSRAAYMAFPPEVFSKCVNREIDKQRAAQFWAHKRNKRGMKKYLKDVEERAKNAEQ